MRNNRINRPLPLGQVRISDAFWSDQQERVFRQVLPYQWEILNDRVPGAESSYCIHNFKAAGARLRERRTQGAQWQEPEHTFRGFQTLPEDPTHPEPGQFYGFVFQDSDLYKWLEAAAYALTLHPDAELERQADEAVDLIGRAQHESGYLDTYYILNGYDRRFTNLRDHHELYCMGHLIEAAVAFYEATGKRKLLEIACRFADCACIWFGEGRHPGYPGHEIAEMALLRLYEVTREKRYLRLSLFFLNQRGQKPYYFQQEEEARCRYEGRPAADSTNEAYHQAHLPVRDQKDAAGHAVRAMYLYSGMADAARLTGERELEEACRRLWNSVTGTMMYLTGGIGSTHLGEAFTYPYNLPPQTAYNETCAAVGLVFFARRMLELEPKGEYGDVMERALYNAVPAGMDLSGHKFFYVNPLEVVPEACHRDERLSHVKTERQNWFGCACCPPNLARLVMSIGSYVCTEGENTLWLHLYCGGEIRTQWSGAAVEWKITSGFPYDGRVEIEMTGETTVKGTLALRIPGWCRNPSVTGVEGRTQTQRDGYWYMTGVWKQGDRLCLHFPMEVRMLRSNPRVRDTIGMTAFSRGPMIYCTEQADNGANLHLIYIDPNTVGMDCGCVLTEERTISGTFALGLRVPAYRERMGERPLYDDYAPPELELTELHLIPYYLWNNRGEGEMRVWLRTAQANAEPEIF